MTRYYPCPSGHVVLLDEGVILPGKLSIGSHGYAQVWNGTTVVPLHRWLLGLAVGDPRQGDHRNRNPLDCRLANLRVTTPAQNAQNVGARSLLGRGVTRNKGRYGAKVKVAGVQHWLGTFDTPQEAATVAAEARSRLMTHADL